MATTSGEPQQSNFTALEQQVCTFEDEYCAEAEKDFQFCLVGYFVSEEVLNPRIMRKIWTQWEKVNMIEVDLNTFLFCFPDERSMNLVFSGGPWIFNGKVLLLKRWKIGDPIKDVDISSIDIWVHVFNLPVHLVREESGRKAVGSIAKVIASERRIESEGGSNYVRVRAQFPVADPLPRGTFIKVRGEQIWLDFRYERIPDICHWCGRLTHESNSCNVVPEDLRSELEEGYGDWLLFHPSSQIVKGEADRPTKTESADQREGKKQQEKGERKRKEDAERKAKLDEIAEKQRQREKELEEKARLEKEALLRRSTEALPRASDNIIPPGRAPPLEHPGAAPAAAAAARGPAPGKYVPAHLRGRPQQGAPPSEADGRGARVPPSRGGIGAKPTSRW